MKLGGCMLVKFNNWELSLQEQGDSLVMEVKNGTDEIAKLTISPNGVNSTFSDPTKTKDAKKEKDGVNNED